MTMTSILILSAITSAFLLFGGVLAWGDFYSRKSADDRSSQPDKTISPAEASSKRWSEAA